MSVVQFPQREKQLIDLDVAVINITAIVDVLNMVDQVEPEKHRKQWRNGIVWLHGCLAVSVERIAQLVESLPR